MASSLTLSESCLETSGKSSRAGDWPFARSVPTEKGQKIQQLKHWNDFHAHYVRKHDPSVGVVEESTQYTLHSLQHD